MITAVDEEDARQVAENRIICTRSRSSDHDAAESPSHASQSTGAQILEASFSVLNQGFHKRVDITHLPTSIDDGGVLGDSSTRFDQVAN